MNINKNLNRIASYLAYDLVNFLRFDGEEFSWKEISEEINSMTGLNISPDSYRKRVQRLDEKISICEFYNFEEDSYVDPETGESYCVEFDHENDLTWKVYKKSPIVKNEITKNNPLKHLLTDNSLILVSQDGTPFSISKDHKYFDEIYQNVLAGNMDKVNELKDARNRIQEVVSGSVTVNEDGVFIKGKKADGRLVEKLKLMLYNGQLDAADRMLKFLNHLDSNPSYRVFDVLYDFVSQNDIEIDEEGYILAYKNIRNDYLDAYTATIDNSVGKIVEVNRREVDENMDRTCSHGLHACSSSYLPHYASGGRTVVVRINPADVVAIPRDYNNAKMRVCKYEVIKEITGNTNYYNNLYEEY